MPAPVYDAVRSFYGIKQQAERLRIKVYPLQRVAGALLLTVDFTPVNGYGAAGDDYFDFNGSGSLRRGAFKGASLIDTDRLIRYPSLAVASAGGDSYSSALQVVQRPGVTYRVGGFFPDPGASVTKLTVDLQLAGLVPDVPVSTDPTPPAGLVSGLPGLPPAPQRDDLVVWPAKAPDSSAYSDRHDLVAPVAGGTVNEASGGVQGLVTVNADVLFAFDSATLSAQGTGAVRQAAAVLTAKADVAKPVQIIGYTDSKGMAGYNQQLSTRRASAVAAAFSSGGQLPGYTFRPEGRGSSHPVARNTLPGGADNPAGRALNRRVEIWYTPKASPAAATPSAGSPPVPSTASTTWSVAPSESEAGGGAPAQPAAEPAVTLPRVALPNMLADNGPAWYVPQVYPAVRVGRLTLVSFDLTLEAGQPEVFLASALSNRLGGGIDLSDVHAENPATRQAFLPAYDSDNDGRVLCTYTDRMNAGAPYHYSLLVAGVPAGVSSVSVSLGALGKTTGVPVR